MLTLTLGQYQAMSERDSDSGFRVQGVLLMRIESFSAESEPASEAYTLVLAQNQLTHWIQGFGVICRVLG